MNWQSLMALGFGALRLTPETFWSMSPREFTAALAPFTAQTPMTPNTLRALAARFPDEVRDAGF